MLVENQASTCDRQIIARRFSKGDEPYMVSLCVPNELAAPCYPGTKTARSTERAVVLSDGVKPANEAEFPLCEAS